MPPLPVLSRKRPRRQASLWAPTVSDRHCEGEAFSWFSCPLLGSFRGTANSSFLRGGAASGWQQPDLFNGGQRQHNLFFSRLQFGWETLSLDLGHYSEFLNLLPYAPRYQGPAFCPGWLSLHLAWTLATEYGLLWCPGQCGCGGRCVPS